MHSDMFRTLYFALLSRICDCLYKHLSLPTQKFSSTIQKKKQFSGRSQAPEYVSLFCDPVHKFSKTVLISFPESSVPTIVLTIEKNYLMAPKIVIYSQSNVLA